MANYTRTKARALAIEACTKHPDDSNLMLARMLKKNHPLHFNTVDSARSMVRTVRGALGNRKADVPREKRLPGQQKEMPPSLAKPFDPFVMDGCKRVGVISDIHVPYHSEKAWEVAMTKLSQSECDGILINGDFCDFYRISRYEKEPDARSFADEIKYCIEGLEWMRSWFPKARIVLKEGNHEARWDSYIWTRAPELFGIEACRIQEMLKLRSMGIEYVADQRPVMVGKLPVLHGHEVFKGFGFAPANAARGLFLKVQHTALIGHVHRSGSHVEPDMFDREVACWSVGCLASLRTKYNPFAKSNHGFAFVDVSANDEFNLQNFRITKNWQVRTA